MSTAHNCKTEGSLLISFDERRVRRAWSWLGFPLDATEFFGIGEDEVHVLDTVEWMSETVERNLSSTLSKASICPVICRPSFKVTLIR